MCNCLSKGRLPIFLKSMQSGSLLSRCNNLSKSRNLSKSNCSGGLLSRCKNMSKGENQSLNPKIRSRNFRFSRKLSTKQISLKTFKNEKLCLFLYLAITVAAMRSAGLRSCVCINRDENMIRELHLQNL